MTGRPEPDPVIAHGPVTLRRYRRDDLGAVFEAVTEPRSPEGTGLGVVWRLTRVR